MRGEGELVAEPLQTDRVMRKGWAGVGSQRSISGGTAVDCGRKGGTKAWWWSSGGYSRKEAEGRVEL